MALRRGRRRRPGRRVRRPARGPAQPGPGRRPPGHRPKSNRVGHARSGSAQEDVPQRPAARCRCTCATHPLPGAAKLGHGEGYDYPHDDPRGWVAAGVPSRRGCRPARTTSRPTTASSRRSPTRIAERRRARTSSRRPMDAGDAAAVVVAVVSVVARRRCSSWAVVALTAHAAASCGRRSTSCASETRAGGRRRCAARSRQANAELERVDDLLGTAESIAGTVDSAVPARLPGVLATRSSRRWPSPRGTGRAARRFRRTGRSAEPDVQAAVLARHRRRLRLRRVVLADAVRAARRSPATRPSACRPTSPARSRASAATSAPPWPRAARPCASARPSCGPSSTRRTGA